jgi:glycopeptide antibiotics resistance protein
LEALIKTHYFTLARIGLASALIVILFIALLPLDKAPLPGISDKIQHLAAFLTLSFLVDTSFPRSQFNRWKVAALMGYGLLIELLQLQTDYRFVTLSDLLANASGLVLYYLSIPLLKKLPLINWRWNLQCVSE